MLVDCCCVSFIVGEITPLLQSGKEAFLGVIALAAKVSRRDTMHSGKGKRGQTVGWPYFCSIGFGQNGRPPETDCALLRGAAYSCVQVQILWKDSVDGLRTRRP